MNAAFRKRGVGRQLMEAFEAWAASRECTLVSLATRAAGPFYERLGYAAGAEYFKKVLEKMTGEFFTRATHPPAW